MTYYEFETNAGIRIRFLDILWYPNEDRDGREVWEIDSCRCQWQDKAGKWREMPANLAHIWGKNWQEDIKDKIRASHE